MALVSAVLAGCERQGESGAKGGSKGGGKGGMDPAMMAMMMTPEVVAEEVKAQKVVLTSELPGRTSGYLVAEIRPQVGGLVQKRCFEEGADVGVGQILYQIDPASYQAALDAALANVVVAEKSVGRAKAGLVASEAGVKRQASTLELAKINRQRMEELYKAKAVSAAQRDQAVTDAEVAEASLRASEAAVETDRQAIGVAEAAVLQARVAVETARIQLGYTKIVAPIAGRIGRSAVTDGALVTAYQPMALATIQQLNPIYVDVPQSTSQLLSLKKRLAEGKLQKSDEQVGLVLEDGSAYGVKGKLQFHEVTVDPSTGSVILRMVFDNAEGMLLPGMFVKAVVPEGTKEQAILVPHRAINRDNRGEPWVFVVEEGKAIQRKIVTDREIGGSWLVTEGLKVGDRVIVEGAHGLIKVRPGMGVREPAPKKE